jgi:hydrogenase accessory protein HypB
MHNRGWLADRGILALNLVSSPGSGKTSCWCAPSRRSGPRAGGGGRGRPADQLRRRAHPRTGAPALQINTGKGCHLDARMVGQALEKLAPPDNSLLLIENVGNLVCPAAFDLGEAAKVVVLSVTEGEDKPPNTRHVRRRQPDADQQDRPAALPQLRHGQTIACALRVNPRLQVIQVSATTGAGFDAWLGWIDARPAEARVVRRNGRATARPDRALEAALDAERLRKSEFMLIVVDPTRVARRLYVCAGGPGWASGPLSTVLPTNSAWSAGCVTMAVAWRSIGQRAAGPAFTQCLATEAPPLARVDAIEPEVIPPDHSRRVSRSCRAPKAPWPPPSVPMGLSGLPRRAVRPHDRRWRYPFINCTHCGPRYTITRSLPYDRARTSMAGFELCPGCAAEYRHPGDRRFHAEPNACPVCGPQLSLIEAHGVPALARDPWPKPCAACNWARSSQSRAWAAFIWRATPPTRRPSPACAQRKQRPTSLLAPMAANRASLKGRRSFRPPRRRCSSAERPIVLLDKRPASTRPSSHRADPTKSASCCPTRPPLPAVPRSRRPSRRHRLARRGPAAGLVMTSANPHGEPLVQGNDEALERLSEIADVL